MLASACQHVESLNGHVVDVVDIIKPPDLEYAIHLAKVVSKLSPIMGNMIEYKTCGELNGHTGTKYGTWKRQDPDFPDALFVGSITPPPGIEIKAWYPLATEITARFKESQAMLADGNTNVAMLAWVPEHVLYGRPRIIGVFIATALSIAKARDDHYHNPPDYIVVEPGDTAHRTANLQQRNCSGYKLQDQASMAKAEAVVKSWGKGGRQYSPDPAYQAKVQALRAQFNYGNPDTNFAKMDRIKHGPLEKFKAEMLRAKIEGRSITEWAAIFKTPDTTAHKKAIADLIR